MSRRQPPKAERDALRLWLDLCEPGAPIPEHVAEIAREIRRLALSRKVPAKEAAVQAAAVAGLTGRAIADFRAEQRAIWTKMFYLSNRSQQVPDKSTVAAGSITDVGERQVYRRLKRSR